MNKIAIYSVNTGNYRNEINKLNKYFKTTKKLDNIDYYFFTDKTNIRSDIWNIVNLKIMEPIKDKNGNIIIDGNRNTAKYIKWNIHSILSNYDMLIWIDNKCLNLINTIQFDKITNICLNSNENNIFFWKHPRRTHAKNEIDKTISLKYESMLYGNKFKKIIENIDFKVDLPDTCLFYYKNNAKNRTILSDVYNSLIEHKLKRDQNVIQYVFYKNNYEENIVLFNDLSHKNEKYEKKR